MPTIEQEKTETEEEEMDHESGDSNKSSEEESDTGSIDDSGAWGFPRDTFILSMNLLQYFSDMLVNLYFNALDIVCSIERIFDYNILMINLE